MKPPDSIGDRTVTDVHQQTTTTTAATATATPSAAQLPASSNFHTLVRRVLQVLGGPEVPHARAQHVSVLLALISHGANGANMRPSIRTLELQALLSRPTVKRVLRALEEWCVIRATDRPARKPVVYAIGDVLREPPLDNLREALDQKEEIIDARDNDPSLDKPDLREPRAIIAATRHIRPAWRSFNEGSGIGILLPSSAVAKATAAIAGKTDWPVRSEDWGVVKSPRVATSKRAGFSPDMMKDAE